jgi:hypothetical protein
LKGAGIAMSELNHPFSKENEKPVENLVELKDSLKEEVLELAPIEIEDPEFDVFGTGLNGYQ